MQTIGLIGGASCESTVEYYRIINKTTNELLGAYYSAKIILVSLNFNDVVEAIYDDRWKDAGRLVTDAALQLEQAGADFLLICCNTLHKVVPEVRKSINLPLLHILDPVIQEIRKIGLKKVGLLGTQFTMDNDFHKIYLQQFNIETIVPRKLERDIINKIIFEELCHGIIKENSKQSLLSVIDNLKKRGAQGIILGCTELPLLLPSYLQLKLPIFKTTELHAKCAVYYSLQNHLQNKFLYMDKKETLGQYFSTLP